MRRGVLLSLLGIALGAGIGLGALALKRRLGTELMGLLEKEVKASCPCQLAYDDVDVSLLTLSAQARNARILENGVSKVAFERVEADFSLRRLRERIFSLSELRLINGFAKGVGPDSVAFRFVDWLSAPIPPEKDRPGRWKLKLQRLRMVNSNFSDDFGAIKLEGSGASLLLIRTVDNFFELYPSIHTARIHPGTASGYEINQVKAEMFIHDDYIDFKTLSAKLGQSEFDIKARSQTKQHNALSGSFALSADSPSFGLPSSIQAKIEGHGDIGGQIEAPTLRGNITLAPQSVASFRISETLTYLFDHFESAFRLDPAGLTFPSGELRGGDIRLALSSPLQVSRDSLAATLDIRAAALSFGALKLDQLKAEAFLAGNLSSPQVKVAGMLANSAVNGFVVGPLDFSIDQGSQAVTLKLNSEKSAKHRLEVNATLTELGTQRPLSVEAQFRVKDFPLAQTSLGTTRTVSLDADGALAGPLDPELMTAQAALSLNQGLIAGDFSLKQGLAAIKLASKDGALKADLGFKLQGDALGSLQVEATKFNPLPFAGLPGGTCAELSARLDYNFRLSEPLGGTGSLEATTVGLGCHPYDIELNKPALLPVRSGVIELDGVSLRTTTGLLEVSGDIALNKGPNLRVSGAAQLESLLTFLPYLDDLQGSLVLDASVAGAWSKPQVAGSLDLRQASFDVHAADLSASQINGSLRLQGTRLEATDLRGELNSGTFVLDGGIDLRDITDSSAQLVIKQILIEPSQNISLVLSGALALKPDSSQAAVLSGSLLIDSALIERDLELMSVLGLTLTPSSLPTGARSDASHRPALPLDLQIRAPGTIMVSSNLANLDLAADLQVTGTLAKPQPLGKIEALGGWFGLRDRRFNVTSGTLVFSPPSDLPQLDVTSEALLRSRTGETVLVFVDITGSPASPRIRLSSDRGLSEKEILSLITASSDIFASRSTVSTLSQDIEIDPLLFMGNESFGGLGRLVRSLTRIDSVAFEPAFDSLRGTVEPTVFARKKLFENMALVGSTALGASSGQSRAQLIYQMFPALQLSTYAETSSSTAQAAVGGDAIFTILAEQRAFLQITTKGNRAVTTDELLSALRLTSNTRISEEATDELTSRISSFYQNMGYYSARAEVECLPALEVFADRFCHRLVINIAENEPARISAIRIGGDTLPSQIDISKLNDQVSGKVASLDRLQSTVIKLTNSLRSEGFISARITASYEAAQEKGKKVLLLEVRAGSPVTFVFVGNETFSPEQFLATINLFKRKQPFGNNTITILVQNIERLYRERGFLFATTSTDRSKDPATGRTTYTISIDEGERVDVSDVRFSGLNQFSLKRLQRKVRKVGTREYENLFAPRYAISEDIENNCRMLEAIYHDAGYPNTTVIHTLHFDEQARSLEIEYTVSEGEARLADWIKLEGWPANVPIPKEPGAPYSLPAANRYLSELASQLQAQGFLGADLSSRLDQTDGTLVFTVTPGDRTIVSAIDVEGNLLVSKDVILSALEVQTGDVWSSESVDAGRRRLLKLGLFSRVEIRPADGELNQPQEKMHVQVIERPLTTLELGGGVNSEYGLHFFGQATDRSLFADGRALTARLDAYYDRVQTDITQGIGSLTFSDPSVLADRFGWVEDVRFQRLDMPTQEFDLDRVALSSYLHRSINSHLTASFGHTLLGENLDNVSPGAVLSDLDSGNVRLSFLSGVLTYDRRDDPLNPRQGYDFSLDAQLAGEFMGSNANYYGGGSRLSWISQLPILGPRFSVAAAWRAASLWTFGGTSYVPISQRYYLGGRTSVRGFRENSLGPRSDDGAVIGGDLMASQNLELRYLLADSVSFHVFLDAGGLYLKDEAISVDDVRESVGLGARYLSPIGPIGLDFGFPLDERSGEPSFRVHFNIGTLF